MAGSTGRIDAPWTRKIRPDSAEGGTRRRRSAGSARPVTIPAAAERARGRSARPGRPTIRSNGSAASRRRPGRPAGRGRGRRTGRRRRGRGLEVGIAGRDPELLGLVGPGQAPEGPGPGGVVGRAGEEPLVGPGRVAGPPELLVELAEGEPGLGHDPGRRVAAGHVFEEPGVCLGLAPLEEIDGRPVEARRTGRPPSRGSARSGGRRSGGRRGRSGGRRRRRRRGPEPLVGQEVLERRDRRAGGRRGDSGPRPVRAGRPGGRGRTGRRRPRPRTARGLGPVLREPGLAAQLHQEPALVVAGRLGQGDAVDRSRTAGPGRGGIEAFQGQVVAADRLGGLARRK